MTSFILHIDTVLGISSPLLSILFSLCGLLIIFIIWTITLQMRVRNLLGGKAASTIEESLAALRTEVKEVTQFRKDMEEYLTSVERRLKKSIQSVETIRFNPWKGDGSGGNQSFATAFLSERGSGVIFSSLWGRDRVSIFSKAVKNGTAEFELSEEEKESLSKAKEALKV